MRFILVSLFLNLAALNCVSAEITNVFSRVREDGKIEIAYALKADDPKNTLPVFSVKFRGQLYGKKPFNLKSIDGDGKTGIILCGGAHTSVWDVAKDKKRIDANAVMISVEADDVTEEATYLCLDLKKYKMRYRKKPPNIKNNACKTKELWLKRIEPGVFMMGSPRDEVGHSGGEILHEVTLTKAFYIGIFEMTQKQFKAIAGYNPSFFNGAARPVEQVSYNMLRGAEKGADWPYSHSVDEISSYTVKKDGENVTLECPTFFYTLRNKPGNGLLFDLPTEAQWEYACRAGTTTSLNNGKDLINVDQDPEADKLSRYLYNGGCTEYYDKNGEKQTITNGHAKVGSYLPNAWGLYDMPGNVSEWCLDWDKFSTVTSDPVTDPLGPVNDDYRTLRGGYWHGYARYCRSAWACPSTPRSYSYLSQGWCGFRVALTAPLSDNKISFEFELQSETENTLPVFKTDFFGIAKDGTEYSLKDLGKLEYDGAAGITVGNGKHKLTLTPDDAYTNLVKELGLKVEFEDITAQATYLVIDLENNQMRASYEGPDVNDDRCRTEEIWLRRIEPGTFTMGSPEGEIGRYFSETEHQVIISKAFYVGVFEITQKQYEYIIGKNPSHFLGDTRPVDSISYEAVRGDKRGEKWPKSSEVEEQDFLGIIRKRAGRILDLPTEAQWEYACRAGTTTAWNNGTDISNKERDAELDKLGRYSYNGEEGEEGHVKVGSYLPNAWGLYDMHGNVSEWCLDWYEKEIGSDPATDPVGANSGGSRSVRGGNYGSDAFWCRSANRDYNGPSRSIRSFGYGFRLAIIGQLDTRF